MKEQLMNEALEHYDTLFRRVLAKENIFVQNSEYDDCLQEMRFNLIELLHDYRDLEIFKEDYNDSYLFRRFQWLCQDCRRKYLKRPETLLEEDAEQIQAPFDFIADIELAEMLQQIYLELSESEQRAFNSLLIDSHQLQDNKTATRQFPLKYPKSKPQKKISRQVRAYYRKKLRRVRSQIKKAMEK